MNKIWSKKIYLMFIKKKKNKIDKKKKDRKGKQFNYPFIIYIANHCHCCCCQLFRICCYEEILNCNSVFFFVLLDTITTSWYTTVANTVYSEKQLKLEQERKKKVEKRLKCTDAPLLLSLFTVLIEIWSKRKKWWWWKQRFDEWVRMKI